MRRQTVEDSTKTTSVWWDS